MAKLSKFMSQKEIDEAIEQNLKEHHKEEDVARYRIITKICKRRGIEKDALGTWIYTKSGAIQSKQAQTKLHAKPRRAFTALESALVQALDLLAKEGYDVANPKFDDSGKLKLKKLVK